MSVYNFVVKLGSCLAGEIEDTSEKEQLLKKLKSRSFEILLSSTNKKYQLDDDKVDGLQRLFDIQGHIYWRAKAQGEWSEEMNERVQKLMDQTEQLLQIDPSISSVLTLLYLLAETAPASCHSQKTTYGLDPSSLITSGSLKYNPLLKGPPSFNSKIFDITPIDELDNDGNHLYQQMFDSAPGAGLRHQEFFAVPGLSQDVSRTTLNDVEKSDVTNANWVFANANDDELQGSTSSSFNRGSVHQDEGYVTPDQDVKSMKGTERVYIPWETMSLEDYKSVYTWESCGRARRFKEPPFLTEHRLATDHIWKAITSCIQGQQRPVLLKDVSVEAFERDCKYLLIGVESNTFKFSQEKKTFVYQEGIYLRGIAANTLQIYCEDFIQCANYFRYLTNLLQKETTAKRGLVFKALCSNIQRYLQLYRGIVLQAPPLRSLLHMSDWLHGLHTQLRFLVSLCRQLPKGCALLAHLYNLVPLVSHTDLSHLLYSILQSCCTIYFIMLQRWIFEGVCDDKHNEFFILYEPKETNDRMSWNKMYQLNKALVPGFLMGMEKDLLNCGRSMALLKICAPNDRVCLELKKGYPGIVCCMNKAHVDAMEEECQLYKDRCNPCEPLIDTVVKDEAYYTALRTKSYDKIKQAQETKKQILAEQKRKNFDELKKGMEDAEARKLEYRKSQLEEEEKVREEEEKIYQINQLRKEDEKNKMLQYYTAISDAADKRREKAEWKIKRAELHDKRTTFLQTAKQLEQMEYQEREQDLEDPSTSAFNQNRDSQIVNNISSAIVGSGDFTVQTNEGNVVSTDSNDQLLEITLKQNNAGVTSKIESSSEDPKQTNKDVENKEYMLALEVAEKARQSAAVFKERNMFSNYNILTGEDVKFEDRFVKKKNSDDIDEVHEETIECEVLSDMKEAPVVSEEKGAALVSCVEIEEINDDEASSPTCLEPTDSPNALHVQENAIIDLKPESRLLSEQDFMTNKESLPSKDSLKIDEIDMTTIYQNLRMSVLIPLQTQLELANKAVIRLFFDQHNLMKHLECIRNCFFLLDGEFGRNFTRQLFREIQAADQPSYILHFRLKSLLRSAVGVFTDEEYTDRLIFYAKEVPDVFRLTDPKTLDCLSMRYRTYWPLDMVLNEQLIVRFDRVFSFLLKIQRVSWALEQVSYLLKDKRLYESPQFRQVQLHRHIMTHFMTNLNNYLTAVVFEESWYQLKTDLGKSKTLHDITSALKQYCKTMTFRTFLSKRLKMFMENLMELFQEILFFYETLRSNDWEKEQDSQFYTHPRFSNLCRHWENFLLFANYAVKYLDVAHGRGIFLEHLDQLITMVSANDFYRKLAIKKKEKPVVP